MTAPLLFMYSLSSLLLEWLQEKICCSSVALFGFHVLLANCFGCEFKSESAFYVLISFFSLFVFFIKICSLGLIY